MRSRCMYTRGLLELMLGYLSHLSRTPNNLGHWFTENAILDPAGDAAYNAGELYLNLHTPANPGGELRGQIEP